MAFDKGDTEGASKILIEGDPTKAPIPQIAMLRGLIEAKRGKHWAAVPLLAPYVGNGGRDPRARFALAEAYVALKKPQEAWGILAPMADSPNAGPPVLALAAALANQLGKPPSNYQARYAQMQAADPIAARMTAAQAAMAAGKWQDADAIYTQLSEAGKDSLVPLLNNHALVKLALGDKDGATALARKAHKIAPNDPIVADTLGWVIFKSGGSTKEAEALIAQAATARPQDQEIAAHLRAVKSANSGN
jgi:Flp pilus assembly protein TadD